jgi:hypothetical protein
MSKTTFLKTIPDSIFKTVFIFAKIEVAYASAVTTAKVWDGYQFFGQLKGYRVLLLLFCGAVNDLFYPGFYL